MPPGPLTREQVQLPGTTWTPTGSCLGSHGPWLRPSSTACLVVTQTESPSLGQAAASDTGRTHSHRA